MKKLLLLGVCASLALSLAACGGKAQSTYEPDVKGPQRTSAPTPTPSPQGQESNRPGWEVEPSKELEITQSLADYAQSVQFKVENRENLAFFKQNGKTGVIDLQGNIVLPAQTDVHWCSVCGIVNSDESRVYNEKGEVVGEGGHGLAQSNVFVESATGDVYLDDGMGGLVPWNQVETYTADPFIAQVVEFGQGSDYELPGIGWVSVSQPAGYMFILPDGTPLDGVRYQEIQPSSEGAFAAKMAERWGYVNAATGQQLVPFVYLQVRPFKNGLAAVQSETGWGYISLAGVAKTSMTFTGAQTAANGKAWVQTQEGWGVADLAQWPVK